MNDPQKKEVLEIPNLDVFEYANLKPKRSIITRMIIYAIVTCALSILVSIYTPIDNIFETPGGEMDAELTEQLLLINEDESISRFIIVVQGFIAFMSPIITILLFAIGLKLLTLIFKKIFIKSFTMKELLLITSIAYGMLFISDVLRLSFSLFTNEYILYSLGSLGYYFDSIQNVSFPLSILTVLDFFTIGFCLLLAWGLHSFSKVGFRTPLFIIASIYIIYILILSVFIN